jgi:hypothetical protein
LRISQSVDLWQVVTADEKLRAFLELQRVTRESFRSPNAE